MAKHKVIPQCHVESHKHNNVASDAVHDKKKKPRIERPPPAVNVLNEPVLLRFLGEVVEHPHVFLLLDKNPQIPVLAQSVTEIIQDAPAGVALTGKISLGPLKELLVEGFYAEQVWEEIQLRNDPLLRSVTNLLRDPQVRQLPAHSALLPPFFFFSLPSMFFSVALIEAFHKGCFSKHQQKHYSKQNFLSDTAAPEGKKRPRAQESDEEGEEEEGESQPASEEGEDDTCEPSY